MSLSSRLGRTLRWCGRGIACQRRKGEDLLDLRGQLLDRGKRKRRRDGGAELWNMQVGAE